MPMDDIKTPSKLTDDLIEYILGKYDTQLADAAPDKEFYLEIGNPEFLELVNAKGRRFYEIVQKSVVRAISRYWKKMIAEEKVPLDDEKLKPLLEKIADNVPMTRETLVKQQIIKEDITGRSELIEQHFEKIPVKFSFTENVVKLKRLSSINASHINKLVCFEAVVFAMDEPQAIQDKVETEKAGLVLFENYLRGRDGAITRHIYQDIQYIVFEEIGNEYSKRRNLRKITSAVFGNFAGKFEYGNRCKVTGFYRALDIKGKPEKNFLIETVNIERLDDAQEVVLSPEEIENLKKDASDNPEQFIADLADSFASHINENRVPKLGAIFAAVGSSYIEKYRSHIHIYLVGNPGLAKSEILKALNKLRYLSVYVDAPGASARGLTYGQEEWAGKKVLRAGVMIKNELLCLDEFDKMGEHRQQLNTILEQQLASYHKTPFDIDTPVNVSVVAAGNPQNGRWVDGKTIMDNLKPIEPELLSRFLIIRLSKTTNTRKRVKHILDHIAKRESVQPKYTDDQISGWIAYNRKRNPVLTPDTEQLIIDFAEFFESIEQDSEGNLPFETRQEIDVIRFSTALAKILGKEKTDEVCVRFAIKFIKEAMQTLGMKTEAAPVQLDLRDHAVNRDEAFWRIVRELQNNSGDGCFTEAQLLEKMLEQEQHWKTNEAAHGYWNRFSPSSQKPQFWEPKAGQYKKI